MDAIGPPEGTSASPHRPPRSRPAAKTLAAAVAFAAALVAFGAGALWATNGGGRTPPVAPADPVSLGPSAWGLLGTDLGGHAVALSRFVGRPAVVGFFGSWCGPCRRDAPVFESVARQFAGRVSMLSVAVSDNAGDDRAFAARYGWTWPITQDTGFRWSVAFGVPGVPTTYVLGARGQIVDRIVGPVTLRRLSGDLRSLLG